MILNLGEFLKFGSKFCSFTLIYRTYLLQASFTCSTFPPTTASYLLLMCEQKGLISVLFVLSHRYFSFSLVHLFS